MMSFEEWKSRIEEVVRGIADVDSQRRSWFGNGTQVSSPDEMICQVFGDYDVPDFILRHGSALSDSQLRAAQEFLSAIRSFADSTPPQLDPKLVFTDIRWDRIRTLAGSLVREWNT